MRRTFSILLVFLLSFMALIVPFQASYAMENPKANKDACYRTKNLRVEQRKLWQGHVLWTRSFTVSDLAKLEDKDKVLERLLRNQDEIGNSIKPYYGKESGDKLAKLLRQHIILAGQVVDAAKAGNQKDLEKYNKLWYKNADEIADFLSSINPNWSKKELQDIWHKHLQFVTDQAVARIKKDWTADIVAYDKGEDHMLKFADIISKGIFKQFPEKFKQWEPKKRG